MLDKLTNKRSVLQSDGTLLINIPGKDKAVPRKAKLVRQADPDVTPSVLVGKRTSTGRKPWARVQLQPCAITTALQTGCGLKPKSAKTYFKNLRSVRQICGGHSVVDLLKNIDSTLNTVDAAVHRFQLSPWTHAAYLSSVLSVIRHTVACETKPKPGFQAARDKLQAAHRKAHLLASQPAFQNAATDRMQNGWMSLAEVCTVRDSLQTGTKERLLLAMYTLIPPCRNDLACVKIYHRSPTDEDLTVYRENYIVLPAEGQALICYRVFKTSHSLGEVRVALPDRLVAEIGSSLKTDHRTWLFTHRCDPTKPYSNASFSRWANAALERVCGRPITCTLLRHVYSTAAQQSYDISKLDCRDEAKVALYKSKLLGISRAMMHSTATFVKYKFTLDETTQRPAAVSAKLVRPAQHPTPIVPATVA
jgi:hypothetical protein